MKTTEEIIEVFGEADENGKYLVKIDLPYPMRLAWDIDTEVNVLRCHKLIADKLKAVFNDLLDYYGYEAIKALGIDLFGGCFSYRKKRGGDELSTHSWGIAVDLDPSRNLLMETSKTARFARDEYKPMIRIFEKHGFISLGKVKNYDWMHFQFDNFELIDTTKCCDN